MNKIYLNKKNGEHNYRINKKIKNNIYNTYNHFFNNTNIQFYFIIRIILVKKNIQKIILYRNINKYNSFHSSNNIINSRIHKKNKKRKYKNI